jgi:drug/metabolite transporter (DMT)-like permease
MIGGTELAAVGFGLAASLSWGTSDFSGGMAAKRVHIFGVMTISYAVGLVLLIALAVARGEPVAAASDLMWAAGAGLAGAAGLTAQYRALAVGRMGIVAPVAAVLGATIPVIFSAFSEGVPGSLRVIGFGLAILGVALISRARTAGSGADGLGLAVIAGMGFGLFFILIDQVSDDAVFWPLVAARGASFAVLLIVALSSGQAWLPSRSGLRIVLLAGALDVGGNTFFLLAAQSGRLDVASVLSSLYPAVTVILARGILKEHVTRAQGIGIAAALIAIPLIAA